MQQDFLSSLVPPSLYLPCEISFKIKNKKNNNKPDLAWAADALSFLLTQTGAGLTSTEPLPQRNNPR